MPKKHKHSVMADESLSPYAALPLIEVPHNNGREGLGGMPVKRSYKLSCGHSVFHRIAPLIGDLLFCSSCDDYSSATEGAIMVGGSIRTRGGRK